MNWLFTSYLPLMDWQQICEKVGAYNLEICEHSRVSCTELPLSAAKRNNKALLVELYAFQEQSNYVAAVSHQEQNEGNLLE